MHFRIKTAYKPNLNYWSVFNEIVSHLLNVSFGTKIDGSVQDVCSHLVDFSLLIHTVLMF